MSPIVSLILSDIVGGGGGTRAVHRLCRCILKMRRISPDMMFLYKTVTTSLKDLLHSIEEEGSRVVASQCYDDTNEKLYPNVDDKTICAGIRRALAEAGRMRGKVKANDSAVCTVCGKSSLELAIPNMMACGGCKGPFLLCSAACQRVHWQGAPYFHRRACAEARRALKMASDEEKAGRMSYSAAFGVD